VLIAAFAGLCWLDWRASRPGIVLLPLAIVAALLAAGELLAMFRKKGHDPLAWVVYGGVLLTVLAAAAPGLVRSDVFREFVPALGWLLFGLTLSLGLAIVAELRRYDGSGRATVNLSLSIFTVMYVGGLIGFLIQLRLLGVGPWENDGRYGMLALVSLIALVKMSDIGQYTTGRLFGRHKLAPTISPGKTWEGAIGGMLFACVTSYCVVRWLQPWMTGTEFATHPKAVADITLVAITYAICLAVAGMIGDLLESLIKRDAGVKDSSEWMPGFGGVLDLLDSLLVAAPVAYVFWRIGLA
jgi:phosphatidate cytidylyltransferase